MRRFFLVLALCSLASACKGRRELSEWQPSDHQPPPAVAPEGQGEGAEQGGDSNARAAQSLWDMRCATCHGATGRGDGAGRPPGAAMPDMTSGDYPQKRSDAELHAIIKQGRGLMPGFGAELTDVGIEAMVAHVRSLAKR